MALGEPRERSPFLRRLDALIAPGGGRVADAEARPGRVGDGVAELERLHRRAAELAREIEELVATVRRRAGAAGTAQFVADRSSIW